MEFQWTFHRFPHNFFQVPFPKFVIIFRLQNEMSKILLNIMKFFHASKMDGQKCSEEVYDFQTSNLNHLNELSNHCQHFWGWNSWYRLLVYNDLENKSSPDRFNITVKCERNAMESEYICILICSASVSVKNACKLILGMLLIFMRHIL